MLDFEIDGEETMQVTVYDQETIKKHDLIGEATFYLDGVFKGDVTQMPIEIYFKNKMVGTVYVDFEYKSKLMKKIGDSLVKGLNLGSLSQAKAATKTENPEVASSMSN